MTFFRRIFFYIFDCKDPLCPHKQLSLYKKNIVSTHNILFSTPKKPLLHDDMYKPKKQMYQ